MAITALHVSSRFFFVADTNKKRTLALRRFIDSYDEAPANQCALSLGLRATLATVTARDLRGQWPIRGTTAMVLL